MAKRDEKNQHIARIYSQSLLALADKAGASEVLRDELLDLVALLDDNPRLRDFFESPLVDTEARTSMLERTLRGRASDLLVDGLQVINRHGRLALVDTIAEAYRTDFQARTGHVDVEVVTAVPLSDAQRRAIAESVEATDGRKADLVESVDPSLLGGMIVRVGDRKIDTTVAKDLRTVRAQLAERAAREILASRVA